MSMRRAATIDCRENRGFTLVELLIALAVFSVVAVISYQAIDASLFTREVTRERLDQLSRLNYVFNRMQQDLLQVVDRPVLDETGNRLPGMQITGEEGPAIEFTHHGRISSIQPMHYTLQRTRYVLEDNRLYRQYWDVLDRVPDSEHHRQLLLEDVQAMSFEIVDIDQSKHEEWPYLDSSASGNATHAPAGVRVLLHTETYGLISRTFVVRG